MYPRVKLQAFSVFALCLSVGLFWSCGGDDGETAEDDTFTRGAGMTVFVSMREGKPAAPLREEDREDEDDRIYVVGWGNYGEGPLPELPRGTLLHIVPGDLDAGFGGTRQGAELVDVEVSDPEILEAFRMTDREIWFRSVGRGEVEVILSYASRVSPPEDYKRRLSLNFRR